MTFSYDVNESTPLDVVRGLAGDTADPGILADETYASVLASYGATAVDTAPFYRAAADLLRRVAVAVERQPTSVAAPDDGSIGWSASRTSALRSLADSLEAKADALDTAAGGGSWGTAFTVRGNVLTDGRRW